MVNYYSRDQDVHSGAFTVEVHYDWVPTLALDVSYVSRFRGATHATGLFISRFASPTKSMFSALPCPECSLMFIVHSITEAMDYLPYYLPNLPLEVADEQ